MCRPMLVNQASPSLESTFYKRLLELDLSTSTNVEPTLQAALRILAQVTGADLAYLEVSDLGQYLQVGYAAHTHELAPLLAQPHQLLLDAAYIEDGAALVVRAPQQPLAATAWLRLAPITGIVYLRRPAPFSASDLEALELFARRVAAELVQHHGATGFALQTATQRFKRHQVLAALERTHWNISRAARELAVARSYLYKLIHQLNLRTVRGH